MKYELKYWFSSIHVIGIVVFASKNWLFDGNEAEEFSGMFFFFFVHHCLVSVFVSEQIRLNYFHFGLMK